jgi:hypothetical protein
MPRAGDFESHVAMGREEGVEETRDKDLWSAFSRRQEIP